MRALFRSAMKWSLNERMAEWVRRRQGPDEPPVTLHRRRIYILPTRGGVGFGVLLVFMLIAGLNYANSSALFLTFLLGGFALVAMHQCHRNLLGLSVVGANTLPGFAGQHGGLHLLIENPGRDIRHRLEATIFKQTPVVADLAPNARTRLEIEVPTPQRGIVRIPRVKLSTCHPFGLFRAWTWVHLPLEVLVYPRAHGSLPMPAESGQRAGTRSRGGSGSEEWYGLRPFRDGDSPRQVAWKAYARGAPLLVKEYTESGSDQRIFDFSALHGLSLEARLEQLARWIVDAQARGERYGLILPTLQIAPDHGHEHRHRCLAALATFGLEPPQLRSAA
jgi:uncharacterized protein (DUF58 family)